MKVIGNRNVAGDKKLSSNKKWPIRLLYTNSLFWPICLIIRQHPAVKSESISLFSNVTTWRGCIQVTKPSRGHSKRGCKQRRKPGDVTKQQNQHRQEVDVDGCFDKTLFPVSIDCFNHDHSWSTMCLLLQPREWRTSEPATGSGFKSCVWICRVDSLQQSHSKI